MAGPWIQAQIAPDRPEKDEWPAVQAGRKPSATAFRPIRFPRFIAGPGQSDALKEDLERMRPREFIRKKGSTACVLYIRLWSDPEKGTAELSPCRVAGAWSSDNGRRGLFGPSTAELKTRWTSGQSSESPGYVFPGRSGATGKDQPASD